jgi:hypothetical protein
MPDRSDTDHLRKQQAIREHQERELAERPEQPEEERDTHERRSDKAAYLKEKLEEQKRAGDE